jgi:hypothetical protein
MSSVGPSLEFWPTPGVAVGRKLQLEHTTGVGHIKSSHVMIIRSLGADIVPRQASLLKIHTERVPSGNLLHSY